MMMMMITHDERDGRKRRMQQMENEGREGKKGEEFGREESDKEKGKKYCGKRGKKDEAIEASYGEIIERKKEKELKV